MTQSHVVANELLIKRLESGFFFIIMLDNKDCEKILNEDGVKKYTPEEIGLIKQKLHELATIDFENYKKFKKRENECDNLH